MEPIPSPLTLSDWLGAWRAGASLRRSLVALHARLLRDSPAEAWIARTDREALATRIGALEAGFASFADPADALRAMPLFGVPFAVKDNIDVLGLPTTGACPAWQRTVAADATAVARLLAAGAVCMGKTNLDQFATGLVGARSPYGRPSSTFAADRISGGSSSGSAVVVSRGDVAFALGTDTAGSGRVPAGFNNIVGLKPTPGRVGTTGLMPACRSIDCISVLALTVADAAAVLAVMEGPDAGDAYSAFRAGPAHLSTHPSAALRIGIPRAPVFGRDAPGYAAGFDAAVARVEAMGHRAVAVDLEPLFAVADLLYSGPWVAERHAVVQALLDSDPDAVDPIVRHVVERAHEFSATDAFRGQYALKDAQRDSAALWRSVDLLLVPTAPTHPTHADIDADPLGANALLGTYTNFVNLLGWCALALPAGFVDRGLPFGVTFIAPAAADAALARFGRTWEAALPLPLGATGRHAPEAIADLPWPATTQTLAVAVVGAHLSGLPLNGQLTERGATLLQAMRTAPRYRLFALPGTVPPKPGLQRVAEGGAAVAVELWDMPVAEVGSFLALIPFPLGLGALELADGRWVHGFVCDASALAGARDITAFGGWKAFLAST